MKFWWLAFLPSSLFVAGDIGIQRFYFGADSHGPNFIRLDINCLEKKPLDFEQTAWVRTPNYFVHRGAGSDLRTAVLTLYISIPRSTKWISKKIIREFFDNPSLRLIKYRSFIVTYDKSGDKVVSKVVLRGEAYDELLEYFVMPRDRPPGCSGFKTVRLQSSGAWRNSLLSWSDASVQSALANIPVRSKAIDVIEREVEILTTRKPPRLYVLKLFTAVRGAEDPEETGRALMSGTLPLNRDYFVMERAGDPGGESPKNPFGGKSISPKILQDLGARSRMKIGNAKPDAHGRNYLNSSMIEDLYYLSKLPFEPGLPNDVTVRPVWKLHRIPYRLKNEGESGTELDDIIAFSSESRSSIMSAFEANEESDASFNDELPPKNKNRSVLSKMMGVDKYVTVPRRIKRLRGQSIPVKKRRRSSEEMLNAAEKQNDDRDFKPPKDDADEEMYEGIMSE